MTRGKSAAFHVQRWKKKYKSIVYLRIRYLLSVVYYPLFFSSGYCATERPNFTFQRKFYYFNKDNACEMY